MTRFRIRILVVLAIATVFGSVAWAGINWKAVWMEPNVIVLCEPGQTRSFKVFGIHGADFRAELTGNTRLRIESADPRIAEVDRDNGRIVAKSVGQVELRVSFGKATSLVQVLVGVSGTEGKAK